MALKIPFEQLIREHIYGNDIKLLSISPDHLNLIITLPFHHRDPFDRLIIAQAQYENMIIISCDEHFKKYAIKLIWED